MPLRPCVKIETCAAGEPLKYTIAIVGIIVALPVAGCATATKDVFSFYEECKVGSFGNMRATDSRDNELWPKSSSIDTQAGEYN